MSDLTIKDIEQVVVLVQIKGSCHQVLLSKDDKEILKVFLSSLTEGMKLTEELMPVQFETKK